MWLTASWRRVAVVAFSLAVGGALVGAAAGGAEQRRRGAAVATPLPLPTPGTARPAPTPGSTCMNQTEQGVRRSMVGCDTPYAHWLVLGSVHNVTPERWRGGAEAICSPWPDTTEAYYAFSHISGGSVHCAVELTR